jgi:chromosome segregation ATPase
MTLKDLWAKTLSWLRSCKILKSTGYQPQLNDQGLISEDSNQAEQAVDEKNAESNQVLVKTVQPKDKTQSLEKLQEGFNKLLEQLQGINEHLNQQVNQHESLMSRIEQLPKFLESFPALVENQKQTAEQTLEQLKATAAREQQFMDAVEKMPIETAKQTDALVDIDHQLAAAADADVQMVENFNKFNKTLEKLNQSTVSQTDGIMQMSKTFAASDRHLKYIISKQNKRLMWIFITAVSVCVLVILILTGIIIYLRQ